MKYFAYGSNMLSERLQSPNRVPGASCIFVHAAVYYYPASNCIVTEDFTENVVFTEPLRLSPEPPLQTTVVV